MRLFITIFSFICVFISELQSQEAKPTWYIGPYGSLLYSIHETEFLELPGYPACCTENRSGNGLGYDIGLLLHIPMQDIGLRFYLGMNSPSGTIYADQKIGNQFLRNTQPPFDTIARDILVRHQIDATITALSLRPMATFPVPFGGDIIAGLGFSYILTNSFSQQEQLISPDNASFIDGRGIRNESSGTIPNTSLFQTSAIVGYSHNLPISTTSRLIPFIEYHHPLQSLTSYTWNIKKIQVGLALNFGIIPYHKPIIKTDTIIQRDTILQTSPTIAQDSIGLIDRTIRNIEGIVESGLRVDTLFVKERYIFIKQVIPQYNGGIMAVGLDNNGNMIPKPIIKIEEWEQIETFPLLPYIYFDEGSSDLGGTSQHLLLPSEIALFNEDSLPSSTLDIYRDVLNIIGKRLKEQASKTTIAGYRNESINEKGQELSKARAEAVKQYLTQTWGINNNRLPIQFGGLPPIPSNNQSKEGLIENSRVEIQSQDQALLAPLKKKTIIRTMNPPLLAIKPTIGDETPIETWNIHIKDSKDTVYSISGKGRLPDSMFTWQISPSDNMTDEPFNVHFSVLDTNNRTHNWSTTVITDRITLKNKKELRINDTLIEKFALILFEFNKSSLSLANQSIVKQIRESIKDQSIVTIIGHTDITGEKEYNAQLSQARCKEVQRYLGLSDNKVSIIPNGEEASPFDNNSPQGRAYSRTVFVEIRTPIARLNK